MIRPAHPLADWITPALLEQAATRQERYRARCLAWQSGRPYPASLAHVLAAAPGRKPLEPLLLERLAHPAAPSGEPSAHHGYSDGSAFPNPGAMGLGGILLDGTDRLVAEFSTTAGPGSNNAAEIRAATYLIQLAAGLGSQHLVLHSDSLILIEHATGRKRCHAPDLSPLLADMLATAARIAIVEFVWIPRARNPLADALARQAVLNAPTSPDPRPGAARISYI